MTVLAIFTVTFDIATIINLVCDIIYFMKLLFLIGASAVGKMTVGQELAKITDFKLFHNHMTIEPVIELFGEFNLEITNKLRQVIFEEFAKSSNYGMIFTYVWDFNQQSNWDEIENIKNIFKPYGAEFYYVELIASQKTRLERNKSENRLKNKPSKRNTEFSDNMLIEDDKKYRLVSNIGEIKYENYLRIENENLSVEEVAKKIKEYFGFIKKS